VPSLADWEKDWQENPQRSGQPKLLPVNFRSPLTVIAQSNYHAFTPCPPNRDKASQVENLVPWKCCHDHQNQHSFIE
jgi:hypothetical protein